MQILTGKEIVNWIRGKSISQMNTEPYKKKWVSVEDIESTVEWLKQEIKDIDTHLKPLIFSRIDKAFEDMTNSPTESKEKK